jgi:Ca-activated chloride channel family protein
MRFLYPEWFWAFSLLPIVMLWRGRRGPVAAIEYSDVSLARNVARASRSRLGALVWALPLLAGALMILGLARPQRAHSRTEVSANGIDIVLDLDVSGSMQALDFQVDHQRVNRIEVVKSVVSKFIDQRPDDRIGLIAFAGAPYLVSPITLDPDWLQQNLDRVTVGAADDGDWFGDCRQRQSPALDHGEVKGGDFAHGRREQHRKNPAFGGGGGGESHGRENIHGGSGRARRCAHPGS